MVTGFDYLSQDKMLQEHWLKRFVAVVIDFAIVYTPIWLIGAVLGYPYIFPGFFSGVALFAYSFLFESSVGGTIGKMVLRMKAVPLHGSMTPSQALVRNISKVFPLFLFLDWIVGMAVDTKDPRQKWMDQVAHTSVIAYDSPGTT
jgi:uncharacterized RDD family membrane protein YckC